MSTVTKLKTTHVQKHDIEANWKKAASFTPEKGQIIIYDPEFDENGEQLELPEGRTTPYNYSRQKIGDGIHNVNELPFQTYPGTELNVFSKNSAAFGYSNSVGLKGYYISAIDFENREIALSRNQVIDAPPSSAVTPDFDFGTPLYQIGDTFNIVVPDNHYILCGKIEGIEYNTIKYTEDGIGFDRFLSVEELKARWESFDIPWTSFSDAIAVDDYTLSVPSKPSIGCISITSCGFSEGGYNTVAGSFGHAEGAENIVAGNFGHAEGSGNIAGYDAHAEGSETKALGLESHAEGYGTTAKGIQSHAEGNSTVTDGNFAHAEGYSTTASGKSSHSEGRLTTASGENAHSEGKSTEASGIESHAEGSATKATNNSAHAEGMETTASGTQSHAEGYGTTASGTHSHSEGNSSKATNSFAHAEGLGTTASGKSAHSEGKTTTASGEGSHAEGIETKAEYSGSHAEGYKTNTLAVNAHAEGSGSVAGGADSHAEGNSTNATGAQAHAEGYGTQASGTQSHAEGNSSKATESFSHAEGQATEASGKKSHAEGSGSIASANAAHAEGVSTNASGEGAHAEGVSSKAIGGAAHAEGNTTTAEGLFSHAEGINTIAIGKESHAEGRQTYAYGQGSHAEGRETVASGDQSHAEGYLSSAVGRYAHAEGEQTQVVSLNAEPVIAGHAEGSGSIVNANYAHAEGSHTTAKGLASHAEGQSCTASGQASHAEGYGTEAAGFAHAEGHESKAKNNFAHAEGKSTTANGTASHAEGRDTVANQDSSHAEGKGTISSEVAQHVEGRYNIESTGYAHILGNGTDSENRSNAHTVDWSGNAWYAGDIKFGGTSDEDAVSIKQELTNKLDKSTLPHNKTGSRTNKVIIATPMNLDGTFDDQFRYPSDYGANEGDPDVTSKAGTPFDKEYYAKRVTASDGDKGVIMHSNRDEKLAKGLISETDYDNYADHDEPYLFYDSAPEKYRYTIAARDTYGHMNVEPGGKPFQAITSSQLLNSINVDNKYDYSLINTEGHSIFNNPYGATRIFIDDVNELDCPITNKDILRWYTTVNPSGGYYSVNFTIPKEVYTSKFSIGFWIYNNNFRAQRLPDNTIEYHTFRLKITKGGTLLGDTGNIALIETFTNKSLSNNITLKVDANIGNWHHVSVTSEAIDAGSDTVLFQIGSSVTIPTSITKDSSTGKYLSAVGIHFTAPIFIRGEIEWTAKYSNYHYHPVSTTVPYEDDHAVSKSYFEGVLGLSNEYDRFELDSSGFAASYTSVANTLQVKPTTSKETDPFYPKPYGTYTALKDWAGANYFSVMKVPQEIQGKSFEMGLWVYNNISATNGNQRQLRITLGTSSSLTANLFSGISSITVGKTETKNGNSYIVDAALNNWYHITITVTSTNVTQIGIGSNAMTSGNELYVSMPVMIEGKLKWYQKYKNINYVEPKTVGTAIENNHSINLKQGKELIANSKFVYFDAEGFDPFGGFNAQYDLIDIPNSSDVFTKTTLGTNDTTIESHWTSVVYGAFKQGYIFHSPTVINCCKSHYESVLYDDQGNESKTERINYSYSWDKDFTHTEVLLSETGEVLSEDITNPIADINNTIGNISSALDELHTYAQSLIGGNE